MRTDLSKQIRQSVAIGLLAATVIGAILAQAQTVAPSEDNLLEEISTPQPMYPRGAWQNSPDGHVTLMFDVSKNGSVENPSIIASSLPGTFELSALQAVKTHKYKQIDGPPKQMQGIIKRIHFSLDSNPRVRSQPEYPTQALEAGQEGAVVVEFRVRETGAVHNAKVAGAAPIGVFEDVALDAASKFEFVPQRFAANDPVLHKFTFSLNSKPRNLVKADYPAIAKQQRVQGHVIVKFDINAEGTVENAAAIYSVASELEPAAVAAVEQFTFDPNKPMKEVLHKVTFLLKRAHTALLKARPDYPRQAVIDNIEGHVVVRFDIDEEGSVENVSVVEAKPQDIFNESALAVAAKFTYLPKYVDGKPTPVQGVLNKIVYVIGEEKHNVRLKPIHEMQLEGNLEDGSVIVEFDVNEGGHVEQPKIVEVHDTSLTQEITERILDEVSYYWYVPLVINGRAVRVKDVRHRIELRFLED